MQFTRRLLVLGSLALWISGCDCEGPSPTDDGGPGEDAGGDPIDTGVEPLDSGPLPMRDAGTDAGPPGPDCGDITCGLGQRCDESSATPTCVDNTCADLACTATEVCEPHPMGGNVCRSIACDEDVECAPEEYCDGTICVADVCTPGVTRCDGTGTVLACTSSGSGEETLATCASPAYFMTECVDGPTAGACTCEDDWDCPAFTACEIGTCVGTGIAPSCTLDPIPFDEALPAVEIEWGGVSRSDDDARDGTGTGTFAPWQVYSHVMTTPVVANLDDDNGDGLVNELDFPEILFAAHFDDSPWSNGVLRAIHGGGPNRGADFFARCGDRLWQRSAPSTETCSNTQADSDSGAPVAVGDLDGDGIPEIVAPVEGNRFRILRNTGELLFHLPAALTWADGGDGETIAIANLDYAGFAEIIVGRTVYMLDRNTTTGVWSVVRRLTGTGSSGKNDAQSMMACPADIRADLPGMEIVVGGSLYRLPSPLAACGAPPCTDIALDRPWHTGFDGFCAVADVWGEDVAMPPGPGNEPDDVPEVILIDDGTLRILASNDGSTILTQGLGGGERGGAPNVDDFDGDGFMEIASALENFYIVVDLQQSTGAAGACPAWPTTIARVSAPDGSHNPNPDRTPGGVCTMDSACDADAVCNTTLRQCVCLHNGWQRDSDDDSSRMTSSSVFDFNGDGAAEVLYNDECDFRVYEGTTGEVLFSAVSRSRTGIENTVVADVDNDGNAEVVTTSNTQQSGRCDEDGANPIGPNGLRVWSDPSDTWVSARRIWNQQSYHVTNVTEGGGIPQHAPESWGEFNDRTYNTYRSQPRNFGVAPNLVVAAVAVSSPDVACGALSDTVDITFQIRNAGDSRVGPGVRVVFMGDFGGTEEALTDGSGAPLEVVLTASLEPGRSVYLSVRYERTFSTRGVLPDSVRVIVDPADAAALFGAERECIETDNERTVAIDAGALRADLRVELGTAVARCALLEVDVPITVTNAGTAPAADVVVALYAGDPAMGGTELTRVTFAGPIAGGASAMQTAMLVDFPLDREIRIFAVVDPDDAIVECNDANNTDSAPNVVLCASGPI